MKSIGFVATALVAALNSGAALAQDGYIGASIGTLAGTNIDTVDAYSGETGVIDDAFGYDFGQVSVVLDGRARLIELGVNEVEDLDGDSGPASALFALHTL